MMRKILFISTAVLFCLLIIYLKFGFAFEDKTANIEQIQLKTLAQHIDILEKDAGKYSEILQVQRDMYSISIGVILTIFLFFTGLNYLFNVRRTRRDVNEWLDKFKKDLTESIDKIKTDSLVGAGKLFDDYSEKFEAKIEHLKGSHYDALGRLYMGQKSWSVAFIWYVRAYKSLVKSADRSFLNVILGNIVTCLNEMVYFGHDDMTEVSELIPLITDELDKARKDYIVKKIGDLTVPKKEEKVV